MKNGFNIPVITDLEFNYIRNSIDHFDAKILNAFQYARISTNVLRIGIKLLKTNKM